MNNLTRIPRAFIGVSICPVCDYYKIEMAYAWLSRQYERTQELTRLYFDHRLACPVCLSLVEQLWPGAQVSS